MPVLPLREVYYGGQIRKSGGASLSRPTWSGIETRNSRRDSGLRTRDPGPETWDRHFLPGLLDRFCRFLLRLWSFFVQRFSLSRVLASGTELALGWSQTHFWGSASYAHSLRSQSSHPVPLLAGRGAGCGSSQAGRLSGGFSGPFAVPAERPKAGGPGGRLPGGIRGKPGKKPA